MASRKVAKLEALMKIMSFKQGNKELNKFAPTTLISIMLAIEKEKIN
jgi:hypothetical protein